MLVITHEASQQHSGRDISHQACCHQGQGKGWTKRMIMNARARQAILFDAHLAQLMISAKSVTVQFVHGAQLHNTHFARIRRDLYNNQLADCLVYESRTLQQTKIRRTLACRSNRSSPDSSVHAQSHSSNSVVPRCLMGLLLL